MQRARLLALAAVIVVSVSAFSLALTHVSAQAGQRGAV